MMTQKNIDLQLQALEIMAQRYGLVPDAFQGEPQSGDLDEEGGQEKRDDGGGKEDEETLMAHVIKYKWILKAQHPHHALHTIVI